MGYAPALDKAWREISELSEDKACSIKFLSDTYNIDTAKKEVFSVSCNVPAKDHLTILILHYLIKKLELKILPAPAGEWISFKELEGGAGYYPTFKKRTINVVMRKYGSHPEAILGLTERFCAKRVQVGDLGIAIEPFEGVPVLITLWKGDDEFGPEANIHFDKTISQILCTEDTVVMTEFLVHSI